MSDCACLLDGVTTSAQCCLQRLGPCLGLHHAVALAHARDPLRTACRQRIALPVLEIERQPRLRHLPQGHPDRNLIEGIQLVIVIARAVGCDERQSALKLHQHGGRVVAQKHLPAAPLPADMIHVIDIPDEVRFFEPDGVSKLVGLHCPATKTANATGSTKPATGATSVAIGAAPAFSTTQPDAADSGSCGVASMIPISCRRPAFFTASIAHQTRVAAASSGSPPSRATSSASANPPAPSRSHQTSGGRAVTGSQSHPTGAGDITDIVSSPACDRDRWNPLVNGLPSPRFNMPFGSPFTPTATDTTALGTISATLRSRYGASRAGIHSSGDGAQLTMRNSRPVQRSTSSPAVVAISTSYISRSPSRLRSRAAIT